MTRSSKSYPFRRLWAVSLLLPLLCACSLVNDKDDPVEPSIQPTSDHYINLSIVVSSGNENTMRTPQGDEDGDGREEGFERENKVTGITLILYDRVDNDINESLDGPISYMDYYPVRPLELSEANTDYKDVEAVYTTDDQRLNDLNLEKEYGVIVVANYDLTQKFKVGTTTVKEVCDYRMTTIYGESGIAMGVNATNFIMSQEKDCSIDFSQPSEIERTENKVTYKFDNIFIERLAARMDFWAKGATYKAGYETPGYEYPVWKKDGGTKTQSEDKFVLTAITPFNLYNGEEYLIKRITDDSNTDLSENDVPVIYLADEKETIGQDHRNYVLDPYTGNKGSGTSTYMTYTLQDILDDKIDAMPLSKFQGNNEWKDARYEYSEDSQTGDNMIVCYPKENTLWKTSLLYYYATGLRIEGDYYKNGEGEPQHLTYYGFLRHQGETTTSDYYTMMTPAELEAQKEKLAGLFAMNFSVVRNNIYRISIDEITEKGTEDPKITLRIVVKNWDEFKHDTIFM